MKRNSCCFSELIELMWRLAFIKISDHMEEKAGFSNAIHCSPSAWRHLVAEVNTWTHAAVDWCQALHLSHEREPDCQMFSVCSENKRQFYTKIPWAVVGTDKKFLGTWGTQIFEHSPKYCWGQNMESLQIEVTPFESFRVSLTKH